MKQLLQSLGTTGIIQLTNIISGVLAARLLLPEGRGQLAAIMLWPALIAVCGLFSIDQAVAFRVATDRDGRSVIVASSLVLGAILALVGVAVGYVILPLLLDTHALAMLETARLYLIFIPLNYMGLLLAAGKQGSLQMGFWNILRVLVPVAYVVMIGIFYAGGWISVGSFTTASLIANLAVVVVGWWLFQGDRTGPLRVELAAMRGLVRYGITVHISLLTVIVAQRLDQTLIALFLPSEALGLYVVAMSISSVVGIAAGTIAMLAFPKIANQPTPEGKALLVGRYFRLAAVMSVGSALVVFVLSPQLITLLFGKEYATAIMLSRIMLFGTVPAALAPVLIAAYRAYERNMVVNYSALVGLATAAVMLAILLPRFGVEGAAWAMVVAQWAPFVLLFLFARRSIGISGGQILTVTRADLDLLRFRLGFVLR